MIARHSCVTPTIAPSGAICAGEAVLVRGGVKDGTVVDRVVYAITHDVGLPYEPFAPAGTARRRSTPEQR